MNNINKNSQQNAFLQESPLKRMLYSIENLIKLVYLVFVTFKFHACYIGMMASIMGIFRRRSLKTEFTMNILYLLNISQFNCTNNYMYHLPVIIHYIIGISEYINLKQGELYKTFQKYVITVQNTKEFFLDFRCKYEFALIPLSVLMIIVSDSSWWLLILHIIYVITKVIASQNMNEIFFQTLKKLYVK